MAQTSVHAAARQSKHAIRAQAHTRLVGVKRQHAACQSQCRSQNRMHVQKALMEYLLLDRQPG